MITAHGYWLLTAGSKFIKLRDQWAWIILSLVSIQLLWYFFSWIWVNGPVWWLQKIIKSFFF
jgi:hypothetical protein